MRAVAGGKIHGTASSADTVGSVPSSASSASSSGSASSEAAAVTAAVFPFQPGPPSVAAGTGGTAQRVRSDGGRRLYAHVKRFRERWTADDRFRAAVSADPPAAAAAIGLDFDPSPLAFLWRAGTRIDDTAPEVCASRRIDERAQAYLDFTDDDGGAAESYRAWRARQKARSAFAQGFVVAPMALHLPFSVELTRGCSFGCWFCGLSARPLEAVLPTDLDAWEEMLRALREVFGASAARGFMFWATDPLDHPDYEAYADVFRRVLGRFPSTTTAAAVTDVGRTRRLMALARSADYPYPVLRFSVVSLRRLDRIHAEFSAEELVGVDFAMVNRESVLMLAQAGYARSKATRWPERLAHERSKIERYSAGRHDDGDEAWAHRTIACVSGFLIEPLAGRVRLISPEPCSDRWADGYVVFGEERFEDAGEFARALERLVARHMKPDPPGRLALQRGVKVVAKSRTAATAEGRGHRVTFMSKRRGLAHLPALADAFHGGARVEEAVGGVAHRFGVEPRLVRKDMTNLWRQGILIEPIFAFSDTEESPPLEAASA